MIIRVEAIILAGLATVSAWGDPGASLEHSSTITNDQIANYDLDRTLTNPDVGFLLFVDHTCEGRIDGSATQSVVFKILEEMKLGLLGRLVIKSDEDATFPSSLGRFDFYCSSFDQPEQVVVAIFSTFGTSGRGYGFRVISSIGMTTSDFRDFRLLDEMPRRLSGNYNYEFLGFLEGPDHGWIYAVLLGGPATANTMVVDHQNRLIYEVDRSTPFVVQEANGSYLYVLAREWVSDREHHLFPVGADVRETRRFGESSKTHEAAVLRRFDGDTSVVVDKLVYKKPDDGDALPLEVTEFMLREEARVKLIQEQAIEK